MQERAEASAQVSDTRQLQQQLLDLAMAQPDHVQHEGQAALHQPVLALLSSGQPPIPLGAFQGDMQRARIMLEAAGFLVPLDANSSMLPSLQPGAGQQPNMLRPAGVQNAIGSWQEAGVSVYRPAGLSAGGTQEPEVQGRAVFQTLSAASLPS